MQEKSVFLNMLEALFAVDSRSSLSVQYLPNKRWGEAELVGSMVNIRHDLDRTDIKNVGKIKELAAGDRVRVERKNQYPFLSRGRSISSRQTSHPPARQKILTFGADGSLSSFQSVSHVMRKIRS